MQGTHYLVICRDLLLEAVEGVSQVLHLPSERLPYLLLSLKFSAQSKDGISLLLLVCEAVAVLKERVVISFIINIEGLELSSVSTASLLGRARTEDPLTDVLGVVLHVDLGGRVKGLGELFLALIESFKPPLEFGTQDRSESFIHLGRGGGFFESLGLLSYRGGSSEAIETLILYISIDNVATHIG